MPKARAKERKTKPITRKKPGVEYVEGKPHLRKIKRYKSLVEAVGFEFDSARFKEKSDNGYCSSSLAKYYQDTPGWVPAQIVEFADSACSSLESILREETGSASATEISKLTREKRLQLADIIANHGHHSFYVQPSTTGIFQEALEEYREYVNVERGLIGHVSGRKLARYVHKELKALGTTSPRNGKPYTTQTIRKWFMEDPPVRNADLDAFVILRDLINDPKLSTNDDLHQSFLTTEWKPKDAVDPVLFWEAADKYFKFIRKKFSEQGEVNESAFCRYISAQLRDEHTITASENSLRDELTKGKNPKRKRKYDRTHAQVLDIIKKLYNEDDSVHKSFFEKYAYMEEKANVSELRAKVKNYLAELERRHDASPERSSICEYLAQEMIRIKPGFVRQKYPTTTEAIQKLLMGKNPPAWTAVELEVAVDKMIRFTDVLERRFYPGKVPVTTLYDMLYENEDVLALFFPKKDGKEGRIQMIDVAKEISRVVSDKYHADVTPKYISDLLNESNSHARTTQIAVERGFRDVIEDCKIRYRSAQIAYFHMLHDVREGLADQDHPIMSELVEQRLYEVLPTIDHGDRAEINDYISKLKRLNGTPEDEREKMTIMTGCYRILRGYFKKTGPLHKDEAAEIAAEILVQDASSLRVPLSLHL